MKYLLSLWHASAVCEGSLELWKGWARCCYSAHLYKKHSNILFFAGSAFPASTAHTPLASAFIYSKNIRGLGVGFPSTLLCKHLNLFARQFLGVYCRCWPQKVLQNWMYRNVKQSSMTCRWFQWTKQVVFVKKKKKNPKRKACFRWLPFIFFSMSEWIATQVPSWWTSAIVLVPCIFWLCWFTADTSVDVHVDTSCCWKNKGTAQL